MKSFLLVNFCNEDAGFFLFFVFGKISKSSSCIGCFQTPETVSIMAMKTTEQGVTGRYLLVVSIRHHEL